MQVVEGGESGWGGLDGVPGLVQEAADFADVAADGLGADLEQGGDGALGQAVAVDTRDARSYGRARIPGAAHIPMEEIETRLAELHMLPGAPILYCRSGDKTKELAEKLADQGMPVAFLEGGMLAWEADGLPIERVR